MVFLVVTVVADVTGVVLLGKAPKATVVVV
jgi:hypothetical protein